MVAEFLKIALVSSDETWPTLTFQDSAGQVKLSVEQISWLLSVQDL